MLEIRCPELASNEKNVFRKAFLLVLQRRPILSPIQEFHKREKAKIVVSSCITGLSHFSVERTFSNVSSARIPRDTSMLMDTVGLELNTIVFIKEKIRLTTISPKLAGIPVSGSTTRLMPPGGFFIKSRTSLETLAMVRGGKFSTELMLPVLVDRP